MLKIRLKRVGRKHDPSFRIVVVESTKGPKSGNYIETLGNYDARSDKKNVDAERVKYWMGVGAQPSDTVHNILIGEGVISGKKINVLPKKNPIKKESENSPQSSGVSVPASSENDNAEEEKEPASAPEETPAPSEPEVSGELPSMDEPPASEEKTEA